MPKKILYLGNMLSAKNRNVTTIETLGQKLRDLSYVVKSYSDQDNKVLRLISILSAIIRHRQYDYVLIDTYSTNAYWYAWFSAKLCQVFNIPYLMILHGGNLPKRLITQKRQSQNIFKKATINICPSAYLYEAFSSKGFSNLKVIPNFIEIENYSFKQRQHIQPKLLWVRAFADMYNPILALKVLKKLMLAYPNARMSMIGPFKDQSIDECKQFAKEHQLPVEFTGRMSKEEWVDYANDFDVFINTTNVDNTPVSVIEAMALGLPVVTTNVGGLPYLLDNNKNALLVPPSDVTEMCNAVSMLLNNPRLTSKLSINGRKLAESFDWEIVKEKWLDILQ